MQISLTRAGSFHADKMVPNAHKCAAMHTKVYRYELTIIATDRKLSPEGYVINNERVQSYFDNRWGQLAPAPWDAMSCENLALISAREIGQQLRAEGVNCVEVHCMIEGSNGARITACWKPSAHGAHDAPAYVERRIERPEELQSRPTFGFDGSE